MGILYELIVDEKDAERATEIIKECDPEAKTTHAPVTEDLSSLHKILKWLQG